MTPEAPRVTLAVPCRADEPDLGRTLRLAWESWQRLTAGAARRLEVLVCVNGQGPGRPLVDLRSVAAAMGSGLVEMPIEVGAPPTLPPAIGPLAVVALLAPRAGKAIAWNLLRATARAPVALFMDADVTFAPDAFGLLLDALATVPGAALVSGKTVCATRPGLFERVMAAPYGIDFPNLSPQLYAARVPALPLAMPEALIEPERWLELVVGRERVVRVPAARVAVRLPGTFADFYRQRVRIEMGKIQIAHEYPGLAARGPSQPGARATLASLGPAGLTALAAYLALRNGLHAIAWWRYRRGRTAGVWRQAVTTKRWGWT